MANLTDALQQLREECASGRNGRWRSWAPQFLYLKIWLEGMDRGLYVPGLDLDESSRLQHAGAWQLPRGHDGRRCAHNLRPMALENREA